MVETGVLFRGIIVDTDELIRVPICGINKLLRDTPDVDDGALLWVALVDSDELLRGAAAEETGKPMSDSTVVGVCG